MVSVRAEKSFVRVLNALAELEALSSIDAFDSTEAWVARLQRRLDRYLTLTGHLTSHRPALTADLLMALQLRVKDAVASGDRSAVFAAAADLREELAAHFRSLSAEAHAP
jgi:hypothetical protein